MSSFRIYCDVIVFTYLGSSRIFCSIYIVVLKRTRGCKLQCVCVNSVNGCPAHVFESVARDNRQIPSGYGPSASLKTSRIVVRCV